MSLRDVVDGVMGGGAVNLEEARSQTLDKLRHARQAFADHQDGQSGGGGWITRAEEGRVAFSPTRFDGQQLVIDGKSVNFWQASEMPAVLDAFERAINAGELDPQLIGSTPAGHSLPIDRLNT